MPSYTPRRLCEVASRPRSRMIAACFHFILLLPTPLHRLHCMRITRTYVTPRKEEEGHLFRWGTGQFPITGPSADESCFTVKYVLVRSPIFKLQVVHWNDKYDTLQAAMHDRLATSGSLVDKQSMLVAQDCYPLRMPSANAKLPCTVSSHRSNNCHFGHPYTHIAASR